MPSSRNLGFHLHRVAWSAVLGDLRRHPRDWPLDPWVDRDIDWDEPQDNADERRLDGCVALLQVYTRMIKILQRRIDWTVNEALATGASFGDIADACGVSRQAARQRWLRNRQRRNIRTVRPTRGLSSVAWDGLWPDFGHERIIVRLVGGPYDGRTDRVKPGEPSRIEIDQPHDSDTSRARFAKYLPAEDDLSVYLFDGLEDGPPYLLGEKVPPKPRVYEVAAELGVSSREILAKLKEMGESARSAASTVEPDSLSKLWEQFGSPLGDREDSEAAGSPNA